MGGTAIYQQFFGGTDLVAILQNVGTDGALWAFLNTLPFSKLLGVAHLCLIFLFLVTTCNSGAYVWSQNTMHQQYKSLVPSKPVRLTYCLALSVVAMLLLLRGKRDFWSSADASGRVVSHHHNLYRNDGRCYQSSA